MQALIIALLLQAHGLHGEHVSVRSLPVSGPTSAIITRGYFEKKGSGWEEGHRNEIERGMYDAKGRLIGIVEVGILDSIYKFRNAEDLAGRVTETTISTGTSFFGREVKTLDREGRVEQVDYFDRENELEVREQFFYSSNDRVSRRDLYGRKKSGKGLELVRQVVYAYNKDGSQVRLKTYVMTPKKRIDTMVLADGNGNPLAETTYDQWGKADKVYEYVYDFSPEGIWTKQRKNKKLSDKESVPVDVLYRQLIPIPAK
jgi:hypothetical protein